MRRNCKLNLHMIQAHGNRLTHQSLHLCQSCILTSGSAKRKDPNSCHSSTDPAASPLSVLADPLLGLQAPFVVLSAALLALPPLAPSAFTPLLLPPLLVPKPLVVVHPLLRSAAPVLSLRAAVAPADALLAEKPRASEQVAPRNAARGEESLRYLHGRAGRGVPKAIL